MLIFKSMSDFDQLSADDPAFACVDDVMKRMIAVVADRPYRPDCDGYLVLVQPSDLGKVMPVPELDCLLEEVQWEGVTYEGGMFHAVYLCNNEFALSFLIPDAPWVSGKLRAALLENLSE